MNLLLANTLAIVVIFLVSVAISVASFFLRRKEVTKREWYLGLLDDLRGEVIGAFITAIIFTLVVTTFEEANSNQTRIDDLVRSAGSNSNSVALSSIQELRELGVLSGDQGVLVNAGLREANMQDGWLVEINFERAFMNAANLEHAMLWKTNLTGAHLAGANLRDAGLIEANLENADLSGADLRGTDFSQANLTGADLTEALFDETTKLPNSEITVSRTTDGINYDYTDSSIIYWSPTTDMNRYTDALHVDYWTP